MTVAADLQLAQGCRRRYLLKIGGLVYVLNQRVADSSGDDTPLGGAYGLNCLRVPGEEESTSLDLGSARTQPSSLVFELDDIEDA